MRIDVPLAISLGNDEERAQIVPRGSRRDINLS
jgi:hypothetical protein